ncbi:MAG: hypothetical protein ACYSX1_09025 [Planctomycetota bacterium]|jgi:hypothetical protein
MWKAQQRGTYRIDKRYKGIGRIQRASGTTDKKTFNGILAMLTQLHQTAKFDVLKEIQAGVITPLEAYAHWRDGKLDYLPSAKTLQLVDPTVIKFIEQHYKIPTTRRAYLFAVQRFVATMGNHPIQHLPQKIKLYRRKCQDADVEATFNRLRIVIKAYLSDTFTRKSALWVAATEIGTLSYEEKTTEPLTVPYFNSLETLLPDPYFAMVKTMCLTGMGWSEFAGKWRIESDRVWIHGARKKGKGKRRTRVVPLIDRNLSRPTKHVQSLRKALKKIDPSLHVYRFRHTFQHWLERSRLIPSHIKFYMGHSDSTYSKHDIEPFLKEDAEAIRAYLEKASRRDVRIEMPESPFLKL